MILIRKKEDCPDQEQQTESYVTLSEAEEKKQQYLWFTRNDSDTIFTALKPFIADERSDMDSNFNRTIIRLH